MMTERLFARSYILLVTLKLGDEFCDDAYPHVSLSHSLHAKLIIHKFLPLFRDKVPVKHSFARTKRNIYVYIYKYIYV